MTTEKNTRKTVNINTNAIRFADFANVASNKELTWLLVEDDDRIYAYNDAGSLVTTAVFTKDELNAIHPNILKILKHTSKSNHPQAFTNLLNNWFSVEMNTYPLLQKVESNGKKYDVTRSYLLTIATVEGVNSYYQLFDLTIETLSAHHVETSYGKAELFLREHQPMPLSFTYVDSLYPGFTQRALTALDLGMSKEDVASHAVATLFNENGAGVATLPNLQG